MPEFYHPPLHPELEPPLAELTEHLVARERARCEFISRVVSTDLPLLREIYSSQELTPEQEAATLFGHVTGALETLDFHATSSINIPYRPDSPGDKRYEPLFRLDWAQRFPMTGSKRDYVLWPSQRGFALLDGLRAARGLPSVLEQRKRNEQARQRQLEELRRIDRKLRDDT